MEGIQMFLGLFLINSNSSDEEIVVDFQSVY